MYTHCSTAIARFSIGFSKVSTLKCNFPVFASRFDVFYAAGHTPHWNPHLLVLPFCGVISVIANIHAHQGTIFIIAWFAVSWGFTTRMTTTSPVSLSLPYRAENKRFSTLKRTKTGGIQPMLNVACFVQSCLTDADFVIFSNYCLIGTRRRASPCLCQKFIRCVVGAVIGGPLRLYKSL